MARGGNVDYGLGGALLKLGSNLAQGKGFGSGALKGVGKAAVTPGSGIGAGAELAGNLLQKSKNPALQGIGKGLGIASNFAPGGGGPLAALGGLAGGGAGGGGGIGGALAGLAGGGGGNPAGGWGQVPGAGGGGLLNMASQFLGEQGMAVPNEKENMKSMKYSNRMRGVKLMKGGAVYADNGVTTPEPPLEDQQVEYILQGGDTPRESKGYFMVGGQRPMDMKQLIDMYTPQFGRDQARQMVQAMKQEGHRYALPDAMNPYRETPYRTGESKAEADRLKTKASHIRESSAAGNNGEVTEEAERRAKALEEQAMNLLGSPDQRFTKTLQPGEMVEDPTVGPLLEGLSKFRLVKR